MIRESDTKAISRSNVRTAVSSTSRGRRCGSFSIKARDANVCGLTVRRHEIGADAAGDELRQFASEALAARLGLNLGRKRDPVPDTGYVDGINARIIGQE